MSEPTTWQEWWAIHTEWHDACWAEDVVEHVWSDAEQYGRAQERERVVSIINHYLISIPLTEKMIAAIREGDDDAFCT